MTTIEWTDKTWNPVTGCQKISPGCKNCYAEAIADRFFAKQYPRNEDGSARKFTDVRCHLERLMQPLRWKKPGSCFVNSMSDLFHEDVPDWFITDVLGVMFLAHWIRFQVLTKRPERMRDYFAKGDHGIFEQFTNIRDKGGMAPKEVFRALDIKRRDGYFIGQWPLPNVWLGVSVEDEARKQRIDILRETPAAVRFLSIEPQLEDVKELNLNGIHWVICGGESGPGARPFNLAWAESLLEQCKSAGVPFFMKQCGAAPYLHRERSANVTLPGGHMSYASLEYQSTVNFQDSKGGDPAEWPEALRVREWPA